LPPHTDKNAELRKSEMPKQKNHTALNRTNKKITQHLTELRQSQLFEFRIFDMTWCHINHAAPTTEPQQTFMNYSTTKCTFGKRACIGYYWEWSSFFWLRYTKKWSKNTPKNFGGEWLFYYTPTDPQIISPETRTKRLLTPQKKKTLQNFFGYTFSSNFLKPLTPQTQDTPFKPKKVPKKSRSNFFSISFFKKLSQKKLLKKIGQKKSQKKNRSKFFQKKKAARLP